MTAEELLETIRQVGGEVWAAGDKLRYNLPYSVHRLIPTMRELKLEVLQLLTLASWDAELDALYLSLRAEWQEQGRFELERLFNLPEDKKGTSRHPG
jgi:hypothetical protein